MVASHHENDLNSEVFPAVSFDLSYAKLVDSIDIDLDLLTEHLRTKGLSDQQIIDLKITFTGVTAEKAGKKKNDRLFGAFLRYDDHISIHQLDINPDFDEHVTDTHVHETEHYVATFDEEAQTELRNYLYGINSRFVEEAKSGMAGNLLLVSRKVSGRLAAIGSSIKSHEANLSFKSIPRDIAAIALLSAAAFSNRIANDAVNRKVSALYEKNDQKIYRDNPDEIRAREEAKKYAGGLMVSTVQKSSR